MICYSNVRATDEMTNRLRHLADGWRDVVGLSDDAIADLVRIDEIDVLVDLTGNMPDSRTMVLARRPAPVQVNYCGYPNTLGMKAVGYRITDSWHDPPELGTDRFHAERLARIPDGCWC